jgi:hypothetical protein
MGLQLVGENADASLRAILDRPDGGFKEKTDRPSA